MPQTEYQRQWYLNNRERILNKRKEYAINNTDKLKEYRKTAAYQKSYHLRDWKRWGLVGDYDIIYERYINTTNCEICSVKLTLDKKITSTRKCMEHCHKTGKFRNITCHKCNMTRKKIYKNNKSGHNGLRLAEDNGRIRWRYRTRRFKNKIDALCYKFICLLKDKI